MVTQAIFMHAKMSIFSLTIYQHRLYTLTNYLQSTITNLSFQDILHDHLVLINDAFMCHTYINKKLHLLTILIILLFVKLIVGKNTCNIY